MSKIITVNGIQTRGESSTDLLCAELCAMGFEAEEYNYPIVTMFDVFFRLRESQKRGFQYKTAEPLARVAEKIGVKLNVVAHSFGCLLVLRAMELGAKFDHVFLYRPAMNKDIVFPRWGAKKIHVIHHPDDKALRLGTMLKAHAFGAMGSAGYEYAKFDTRVKNHLSPWTGHSGDFREGLANTASYISAKLN